MSDELPSESHSDNVANVQPGPEPTDLTSTVPDDQPEEVEVVHASAERGDAAESMLHDFRQSIDSNIQRAEYILGMQNQGDSVAGDIEREAGREVALVRTKLQEAKMWAGKALEAIGAPFPQELRDEAEKKVV